MYPLAAEILATANRIAGLISQILAIIFYSKRRIILASHSITGRLRALKTWQLCTAVVGILSLFFSILAFWTSLDSSRYARWTAQKDFALLCMDDSTRHLSIHCPKFVNYSLPAPPAKKTRGLPVDSLSSENQTDIITPFGPVPYESYGGWRLPDVWESDSCTSWTLQMPGLFPLTSMFPGAPQDLNFELACASTDPPLKGIAGLQSTSSSLELEEPYLSKGQCRTHTIFWVMIMGNMMIPLFLPSLIPEGKVLHLPGVRKLQAVVFILLLYLHSQLCTNGTIEDVITARLAVLLSGRDELDILRQITRAGSLTLLLPYMWQFVVTFHRTKPISRTCTLRCRLQVALSKFNRDLFVPFSQWNSWFPIPITDADIHIQEVLYASLFPALGVFLTWPVDELMLDSAWSPAPFFFLMLLYNRVSADIIDEWRETRAWRDVGREKRLSDGPEDHGGPGETIDYCNRCESDKYALVRWTPPSRIK